MAVERGLLRESSEIPTRICYIASTSAIKIAALQAALGPEVAVVGRKVASGVPEQPVGIEQTTQGLRNRLEALRKALENEGIEPVFLASCENGIVSDGWGNWIDVGTVVLEKDGQRVYAWTAGVQMPTSFVFQASRRGFATTTASSVMAEQLGIPQAGTDPHAYLTGGYVDRQELLAQAFAIAMIQVESGTNRFNANPSA
ncbi:MAG: hypothetical protein A2700_01285 [Candidatus Blackburnbacteria bacterium RIFCSPHIGHO2_01_FULL_44_64]|uniref:inosine/xanthosine triphosphatase n=1 Tax=Candidatus Blackburnbacteria bacterium RIFCSPHIGHO2_02_FULL_44_20 TaxID=1797516 RepID=A0A1G1V6L4_9BACT|nr:MAG: hypothetical protein A2700_01285 [Candidatus Blackburnbacteria bacterium RIFCSPHIGHO2_01_FULL_44_64]OGY10717.1 MAG: hypothetical protein A3E16_01820 [Candidatus Blackburnbacteria bacterium RIFCSPHIGHO2_12_FULL_44_25]OGY11019.1 MAG: hypothetical protein A3D26_03830 [Candidatus Blackburnbacteria bacterium RIFCSPHIGHO2_02_FULL_44_20]OGY15213.1 MAG: hypothetical protein A3A62_02580 [Candidatus Blackburnbacteria bacterium RIFCSPLOWO2_01_FULL_44_43]OGY15848.1 MAG: hypothetical protein A3H88_0